MSSSSIAIKDSILQTIDRLNPFDEIEKSHINNTSEWIQSHDQIFRVSKPDNPNKHLVSYFIMYDELSKKILLVDHKKSGLWLPTGGHVEIDEDPAEAVKRECLEELNVDAEFWCDEPVFITQTVTVGTTAGHTDVSLWYIIKGSENRQYDYDRGEFNSIKWFSFEDIPYDCSDPHMRRFISKFTEFL